MAFDGLGLATPTLGDTGLAPQNNASRLLHRGSATPAMSLVTLHPFSHAELPPRDAHPTAFLRAILAEAATLLPDKHPPPAATTPSDVINLEHATLANNELQWASKKPHSGVDGHGHTFHIESFAATRVCTTAGRHETEYWFARRSLHPEDHASYDEFLRGLLNGHAENEREYIASVEGADKLWEYPTEGSVTAALYEIRHKLPAPLKPRVFPILLVAEERDNEFYVVSVPVTTLGEEGRQRGKKYVEGRYVSVERIRMVEDGATEWCVGTASDAGGALPMMFQKPAIPSTIAKDVGWFIGWVRDGMPRKYT